VLKKLVSSQEYYIKELESKKYELESEVKFWRNNKEQEKTEALERSAEKEQINETVSNKVCIHYYNK
jgi:hypothetical protein